jgi:hypothetical protein
MAQKKQAEYFILVLQLHKKIGSDLGLLANKSWKEKHVTWFTSERATPVSGPANPTKAPTQ